MSEKEKTLDEREIQRLVTRKKILKTSFELFVNGDYYSVKLEDIVKGAKISKSTIFQHFPKGKKQLFKEAIFNIFRDLYGEFLDFNEEISPKVQIQGIIDGTLLFMLQYPKLLLTMLQLLDIDLQEHDNEDFITSQKEIQGIYEQLMTMTSTLIKTMNFENSENVTRFILSALDGFAVHTFLFDITTPDDPRFIGFRNMIYKTLKFDTIPPIMEFKQNE